MGCLHVLQEISGNFSKLKFHSIVELLIHKTEIPV